jgi:hypothetical protein
LGLAYLAVDDYHNTMKYLEMGLNSWDPATMNPSNIRIIVVNLMRLLCKIEDFEGILKHVLRNAVDWANNPRVSITIHNVDSNDLQRFQELMNLLRLLKPFIEEKYSEHLGKQFVYFAKKEMRGLQGIATYQ